jgi:hypothetical protein
VEGGLLCRKTPSHALTGGSCVCGSLTRHRLSIGRTGRTSTWPCFPGPGPVAVLKVPSITIRSCATSLTRTDESMTPNTPLSSDCTAIRPNKESDVKSKSLPISSLNWSHRVRNFSFRIPPTRGSSYHLFRSSLHFIGSFRSSCSGRRFRGTHISSNLDRSRK